MEYCSSCGAVAKENANFCKSCGSKIAKSKKISENQQSGFDLDNGSRKNVWELYLSTFSKYFDFSGRASRKEYWVFYLISTAIWLVLGLISTDSDGQSFLAGLAYVVTIIPTISVGVRRMHDHENSGWYLLIPIYSLVLLFSRGDEQMNMYGTAPLD